MLEYLATSERCARCDKLVGRSNRNSDYLCLLCCNESNKKYGLYLTYHLTISSDCSSESDREEILHEEEKLHFDLNSFEFNPFNGNVYLTDYTTRVLFNTYYKQNDYDLHSARVVRYADRIE